MNNTTEFQFISFEGVEGSGKSTQCRLLNRYLKNRGLDSILLKDPGSTVVSKKIRKILSDKKNNITPLSELFLFLAARREMVERIIKPSLKEGKIVIADRYTESTLAYQGSGRRLLEHLTFDMLKNLCNYATDGIEPQIVFLLDLNPEVGLDRIRRKRNEERIESESLEFHSRVRNGYLGLAKSDPRIVVLDAEDDPLSISEAVKNYLKI